MAVATDGAVAGVVEAAWATHGEMTDEAVTNDQRPFDSYKAKKKKKKKYCIIYIASKVPTWQGSRRNCDFSDLFPPLNEMDDRTSVY